MGMGCNEGVAASKRSIQFNSYLIQFILFSSVQQSNSIQGIVQFSHDWTNQILKCFTKVKFALNSSKIENPDYGMQRISI